MVSHTLRSLAPYQQTRSDADRCRKGLSGSTVELELHFFFLVIATTLDFLLVISKALFLHPAILILK
jgi:hypothetical protein